MNSSFRKRMIVTAIATVLSAPAWAASVSADDPVKARTGAQAGSEQKSSTGGTTGTGTSHSGISQSISPAGTTSGATGAGMTGSKDPGTSMAASSSTSGSMERGNARADNPLYGHSVNNLIGAEIVSASDEEIGDIEHVVLTRDGRTAHAVVSVGGFIGIADHEIAVSLDELQPADDDKWRLNATKEQLEARPKYQSEQYLELEGDQPISGSMTDFAAFDADRANDARRTMDRTMEKVENLFQPSNESGAANARADNPLYALGVTNLVGADIVGASGEEIGDIEHVVLTRDRRTAHAVVSVGGFLGIADHDIVVSLDELQPAGDDSWRLNATKEQLEARPKYRSDQYLELEGDQPISGAITDFALFDTDRNRATDMSRGSDANRTMDRNMDKSMDKSMDRTMEKDRTRLQPLTEGSASDRSSPTTGSGMGRSGASQLGTSQSGTAYGSATGAASGAAASAVGTDASSRQMAAGNARADNPLYSRTVDNLIGADIVDSTGDDIGEIEKVVLTRDRRTAHAVVAVGGFLGIGEHDIAVSLDELTPTGDDKWQLSATKEQLEARPEYQSGQFVELDGDQPISGSITDFAAFETDRGEATDTPRDSAERK